MRKGSGHPTTVMIAILIMVSSISIAQVPDDINGRLWRLCKVWGFAKYYHENNCNVNWNEVILDAIDSTLLSTSNASFNENLSEMLNEIGPISHAEPPLVIEADTNLNAHFDWMDDQVFSQEVQAALDSIQINFRPKENCLVKFNDGSYTGFGGWLSFGPDNILSVPSFSYTKESNRLLALFYYWNIINYYHPDKDLMDQDWDSTLYQFIPFIRGAQSDAEFHIRFLNLVTYINDSHGFTGSPLISNFFGGYYPLLDVSYVEGQTIIAKVGPAIPEISEGDVIISINGIDIDYFRDSLAQFIPASNESILNRELDDRILAGQFSSNLHLTLEDANGLTYNETLSRKYTASTYSDWANTDSKPIWEITTCGYGYVNMGKLYPGHVDQMYDDLKNAPAIIFDVRNYPNGTIIQLIPYLFPGPITYALFTEPDLTNPGWYYWSDNYGQTGSFSNADPYSGKIIILVNASAISHAEYTIMGLQQHPNAVTIGSQSAGADGNVSYITLPGGLYTYWTSLGIYYPDSLTAQRVGVRIDSIVTPTIQGIRDGRDEELEAAFDCLTKSKDEAIDYAMLNIYPNPASDQLTLSCEQCTIGEVIIEAFNVLGQTVFHQSMTTKEKSNISIDVSHWTTGIYSITLKDNNRVWMTRKISVCH